jgi:serine/threonine-protein kinase
MDQPPAPPRLLNPNIDADLETVCLKCLEKDPARRYAAAEEVAEELARYLRGEPIRATPPGWVRSLSRQLGRRREVLDPRPWSRFSFFSAAVTVCTHVAIFWVTQPGRPAALFVPLVCANAALVGLIAWHHLVRRRQPLTPDEGHIVTLYGGFVATGFVLYAVTYPWDRDSILAMYPALALLGGLYHLVVARLYWGPMYLYALAYYLLAVVMKLRPEWAPLEFAALSGGISVAVGFLLRRAGGPTDGAERRG